MGDSTRTPQDMILKDHATAIIAVNQRLKALGIDSTISLPQICVIGDQSAGKSSLIEAISNIEVPKADGTCTRCPVSINLSSGSPSDPEWKCTVFVEERYDYILDRKPSAQHPLGPWELRNDMHVVEMETTRDKSRVATLIAQAQKRILESADADVADQEKKTATPRKSRRHNVQFSPNIVRLDISEGVRPNLCFIDLPGVVSNTVDREDAYLIDLVENLVKQYASDPRNENILTLPMSSDVQTSRACSIIQELQVEDRTLAVFTKPDCVLKRRQKFFVDQYLKNDEDLAGGQDDERTRFRTGSFFVKLGNTSAEQGEDQETESEFFSKGLWANLKAPYRDRLGVPALGDYLRNQLFQRTVEALPDNLSAIQVELSRIDEALQQLPPPPDKMFFCMEVQQILDAFARDMKERFIGDTKGSAKSPLRARFEVFAHEIDGASPTVDYATKSEMAEMVELVEAIDQIIQDRKSSKKQDPYDSGEGEDTGGVKFSLAGLAKINNSFSTSGVPGGIDPKATIEVCQQSLEIWRPLMDKFLSRVGEFLLKHALSVFQKSFIKYKNLDIYSMARQWIIEYVSMAVRGEKKIAESICSAERSTPFTLEEVHNNELIAKHEKILFIKRSDFKAELENKKKDSADGVYRPQKKEIRKDSAPTPVPDKHKSEFELAAKALAYYEIASKRFVDTICQGVNARMLPTCGEELAANLNLHIDARNPENSEQILQWMVEDPTKETTRNSLSRKKEHLIEGRKYIEAVLGGTISPNSSPMKRSSTDPIADTLPESPTKKTKLVHRAAGTETSANATQAADTDDVEMSTS